MNALIATLRYVLITAIRDRMVAAILVAQLAVLSGAELMASTALMEGRAFGLALAGGGIRAMMVLGLITFVSFHVRRMEETREIEVILTRPISRSLFILAYFAAYGVVATLLALCAGFLLGLGFGGFDMGLAEWQVSLILECLIVVALSLFSALSLGSATASVIASLGFYLLCRLGAYFRAISEHHTGVLEDSAADRAVHWAIEMISSVLPRLDLFGQGNWLVHGPDSVAWGMGTLAGQTVAAVALLLLATIFDLHRKRF